MRLKKEVSQLLKFEPDTKLHPARFQCAKCLGKVVCVIDVGVNICKIAVLGEVENIETDLHLDALAVGCVFHQAGICREESRSAEAVDFLVAFRRSTKSYPGPLAAGDGARSSVCGTLQKPIFSTGGLSVRRHLGKVEVASIRVVVAAGIACPCDPWTAF